MNMMRYLRHGMGGVLLMTLTMLSLQTSAYAGMVGTGAVIDQQQATLERGRLLAVLDRDDVRKQLVTMGVDPRSARERAAALSDEELRSLDGRIHGLPAGGDILGVAVFLFLVLLLTDILGYTHIFPFVKKTVH
jgi:hypothetical protein